MLMCEINLPANHDKHQANPHGKVSCQHQLLKHEDFSSSKNHSKLAGKSSFKLSSYHPSNTSGKPSQIILPKIKRRPPSPTFGKTVPPALISRATFAKVSEPSMSMRVTCSKETMMPGQRGKLQITMIRTGNLKKKHQKNGEKYG